jgi:hypothetical protein
MTMDISAPLSPPFGRNLEVLASPGATVVRSRGRGADRDELRRVRGLPAGSAVLVWGSSRSCRTFADLGGVEIDREFLPVPSTRVPLYLIENAEESIDYFCSTLLTLPPGSARFGPFGEVLIALVRAARRSPRLAKVIRGRVLVGRRR